jgi:2-methylcitrate dehydratase PrpD
MAIVSAPANTTAAELAEFFTQIRWAELPEPVRERAKELVLDLLGVALRGSAEPSSEAVASVARQTQPAGSATVIGAGFSTAAAWAALANGTAAHAIELDDVTTESSLHPGVAVIPAAFALAEGRGAAPSSFLEAIVAGYEVTMRVGNALNPASAYARGFHPTGVAGAFGAATAAGRLFGLEADGLVRALGIAGTLAAGSLEYLSDGSWTKRLNAGWAAHAGIVAAQLAGEGFSGPATVFEGRLGLLHAYTDEPAPERLLAHLGNPYQVMRVSIKPYACCRYNHGLIDCILALKRAHGIQPDQVERVRLGVLSGGALLVAEPIEQKREPKNVVDAQFSAPFAAAVALARGGGGPEHYTQATVEDPVIQSLMARTDCYHDPSLDAMYPRRWPAATEIQLRDGRTLATRIEYALGEPDNPVPRTGLAAKFAGLAGSVLPSEMAAELAGRILRLEEEPDLRGIAELLRG